MEMTLGGVQLTTPEQEKDGTTFLLWGPAGCGKTTLAATAPGKKLWINFDPKGPTSLVGRDDVIIADFSDQKPAFVDRLKGENMLDLPRFIEANGIDTVVLDSTTNLADLALRQAVTYVKGASYEFPTLAGYGRRNLIVMQCVKDLARICKKLKKNVIFIAHEASPDKDKEGTVLLITVMLGGQLPEQVALDLSEVWYINEINGKRNIAIRPVRMRKPMKTRMFQTNGEPEFEWVYNADEFKGMTIAGWLEQFLKSGKKIPIPKKGDK